MRTQLQEGQCIHTKNTKRRKTKKEMLEQKQQIDAKLTAAASKLEVKMRVTVYDDPGEIVAIEGTRVKVKFDKTPFRPIWCQAGVAKPISKAK
jgi:hypothetical protein